MSVNRENMEKYKTIKNHPAFEKLNYFVIKSISESLSIQNFRKNSYVLKENIDNQQYLYIVKNGEFKMTKKKPNNQKSIRNNTIEICILIQGETFGLENFKDNVQQLYQYTIQCNSVSGSLYQLNLQELRAILIHHCIYNPLSHLFNYPIQIMKNQIYKQREQQFIQNLQVNDSISFLQQNDKTITNKIRSNSTQLTYTDKINIIIQGQKPYINSKNSDNDSFDEDKYMHDSIMYNIRAMRTNLNDSTKEDTLKRRNTFNTVQTRLSFIKNEDYKSKMKIMNQLGYKLKQKSYKKYYRLWQFKTIDSNDQLN